MAKHTPGPWEVWGPQDDPYGEIEVWNKRRQVVALCQDDAPVHDYNREQWANARLIAAAPELLEALEEMLGMAGPWAQYAGADYESRVKHIRAAIAKAKG